MIDINVELTKLQYLNRKDCFYNCHETLCRVKVLWPSYHNDILRWKTTHLYMNERLSCKAASPSPVTTTMKQKSDRLRQIHQTHVRRSPFSQRWYWEENQRTTWYGDSSPQVARTSELDVWHIQEHSDVPDYLDFLNLSGKSFDWKETCINSMATNPCGQEKHQLYTCSKFRSLKRFDPRITA